MHFHVTYTIAVDQRDAAEGRFKETGALPPDGVTLVSRWHDVGGRHGFMVVESSDFTLVAAYMRGWNDLLTFDITPVVDDQQLAQIMGQ